MKDKLGRPYISRYLHKHPLQKFMLRKADCDTIVEIIVESIVKAVADGQDVGVSGLGRFIVKDKNPKRPVRNFRTGEFYELDKLVRSLKFEPSTVLKEKMRESLEGDDGD